MKKFTLFVFPAILLLILFAQPSWSSNNDDYTVGEASGWDFQNETVVDVEETDLDAFDIDIPAGWDFTGEINWFYDPIPVYTTTVVTSNEDATEAFAWLPMTGYVWYDDPTLQQYLPEGSRYNSNTLVLRPTDAAGYLEDYLIPYLEDKYREDHRIRHFEINDIENNSDLADLTREITDPDGVMDFYDFDAAEANVTFELDGTPVEEKISAVIATYQGQLWGLNPYDPSSVTYWSFMGGTVYRALEGDLDNMQPVYDDILYSVRWNSHFLDEFGDIHQQGVEADSQRRTEQQEQWSERFRGEG